MNDVTVRLPNMPRKKWVERILAAWTKVDATTPGIIKLTEANTSEIGNLLEAAHAELKRAEWVAMIKRELPFERQLAMKIMLITMDDHRDELFEFSKLTKQQLNAVVASGTINPLMQRKLAVLRSLQRGGKSAR